MQQNPPLVNDVFLSFAGLEQRHLAKEIAVLLKRKGYRVFLDEWSILRGRELDEECCEAIKNTSLFLALLSAEFFKKLCPRQELQAALTHNRKIFPIVLWQQHSPPTAYTELLMQIQKFDEGLHQYLASKNDNDFFSSSCVVDEIAFRLHPAQYEKVSTIVPHKSSRFSIKIVTEGKLWLHFQTQLLCYMDHLSVTGDIASLCKDGGTLVLIFDSTKDEPQTTESDFATAQSFCYKHNIQHNQILPVFLGWQNNPTQVDKFYEYEWTRRLLQRRAVISADLNVGIAMHDPTDFAARVAATLLKGDQDALMSELYYSRPIDTVSNSGYFPNYIMSHPFIRQPFDFKLETCFTVLAKDKQQLFTVKIHATHAIITFLTCTCEAQILMWEPQKLTLQTAKYKIFLGSLYKSGFRASGTIYQRNPHDSATFLTHVFIQ